MDQIRGLWSKWTALNFSYENQSNWAYTQSKCFIQHNLSVYQMYNWFEGFLIPLWLNFLGISPVRLNSWCWVSVTNWNPQTVKSSVNIIWYHHSLEYIKSSKILDHTWNHSECASFFSGSSKFKRGQNLYFYYSRVGAGGN